MKVEIVGEDLLGLSGGLWRLCGGRIGRTRRAVEEVV